MVEKLYRFACDDCKKVVKEYPSKKAGQDMGWAVARNGKTCYCPACAPYHRSAGCKGVSTVNGNQIILSV